MSFVEDSSLPMKGYYEIREVKLYEGSAVTFGSNDQTNVISVMKSEERATYLDKLNQNFNTTLKSLLERKETSEGAFEYEMKLKYINSQLLQLASAESVSHSVKTEPLPIATGFDWLSVVSKINV
jgi:hypothetical protein